MKLPYSNKSAGTNQSINLLVCFDFIHQFIFGIFYGRHVVLAYTGNYASGNFSDPN